MISRPPRRVVVLGAGRVGALIARDLSADAGLRVTAVDRSDEALNGLGGDARLDRQVADLASPAALDQLLNDADLVVIAVPGAMGHSMLEAAIRAGLPVVDVSFGPEDPLRLDAAARRGGVPAVVDCGVAPGLSNWLVGRSVAELNEVDSVEILVGGLPLRRVWPYEYRAVFSPTDVIEEYVRPCRMRENGRNVVVPALSGVELIDLPHVGSVEAFYTDGLRTLLDTIPARTLREKTLRYPGHAEKMRMLREGGFFSEEPLSVGDIEIAPRQVTERLMFEDWALPAGEEEITALRVEVSGRLGDRIRRIRWDLCDRTDRASGDTSMARTTGFPCAIVARMLADGRWAEPGVHPPEILGREAKLTDDLLAELETRGVRLQRTQTDEPING